METTFDMFMTSNMLESELNFKYFKDDFKNKGRVMNFHFML